VAQIYSEIFEINVIMHMDVFLLGFNREQTMLSWARGWAEVVKKEVGRRAGERELTMRAVPRS